MLKNPLLHDILARPSAPAGVGNAVLSITGDEVLGAGYKVPIVGGIPDFVSHAPPHDCALTFTIPLDERPAAHVLTAPASGDRPVPDWFGEAHCKFRVMDEAPRGLLLDVGCGQGNRATFETLGYGYIGSDISFNSGQRDNTPADVDLVADAHRLPLVADCLAAINSTAVIEHLYLPYVAVREWWRVLKPGGLFVGSCSFLEAEHFDSQCHLTALGLYRLLRSAGFVVEHIHPGLSLWELHSYNIYFGIPFHSALGRLHKRVYLMLSEFKRAKSAREKLFRHAAVFNFVARKPAHAGDLSRGPS
jgi:SAM-dependent methyltransferase